VYGVLCKQFITDLTHPVSPQLATKKLAAARNAEKEEEPDYSAEDRKFHAQPLPDFARVRVSRDADIVYVEELVRRMVRPLDGK